MTSWHNQGLKKKYGSRADMLCGEKRCVCDRVKVEDRGMELSEMERVGVWLTDILIEGAIKS